MSTPSTIPYKELSWKLIVTLAVLGLLWPFTKAIGLTDDLPPAVIGGAWIGVRVVWIIIVVAMRNAQPFWTLFFASLLYSAVSVIPQQITWDEAPAGRIPAFIATLVMGAATGAVLGAIATGIRRLQK